MRYIVTGINGQLGGKIAENMLQYVSGKQLIFTCSNLSRLPKEKVDNWTKQGVSIREANYDKKEQMIEAFRGGNRP
ncbi:Rossmann-fold NAD(P)-binding domain-containing protein [Propionispira raffinosivorans]|uniref:KR domain-containing protein n=1 Tax=Propionispira raffinosivorans TaxID=86959 RepID=UPI00037E30E7|nr:KR domain-containing protein [Propionispira raffinosivorans]